MNGPTRTAILVLATFLAVACDTKGENIPVEIARDQPPKPLVGERVRLAPEPAVEWRIVRVADREWAPTATEYALPARHVRPIGEADGLAFHVLVWDDEPYDRLLVPAPPSEVGDAVAAIDDAPRWVEFLEVY